MSRPTVEDVSDSDPSDMDIDTFPPPPLPSSSSHHHQPITPRAIPQSSSTFVKRFQCLYPIYFDARRARSSGRRLPASLSVQNPLAVEIAAACHALGLPTALEMDKRHPNDWANPGRVRVDLHLRGSSNAQEEEDNPFAGNLGNKNKKSPVRNKHHLLVLVAEHLRKNPTTEESPALRARIPGAPPGPGMGEEWPRPAVPRGWKMGDLLPFVSPALTGGGVSEDLLNDMMKQMQGGGNPMEALMGGMGGGGGGGNPMAALMGGMGGGGGDMGGSASGSGGGGGAKKKGKGKAK